MSAPAKDISDLHAQVGPGKLMERIKAHLEQVVPETPPRSSEIARLTNTPAEEFPRDAGATELPAESWSDVLKRGVITSSDLQALSIVPREAILGSWFRQGDLGFLFAPRGRGKTWLSMLIAKAAASGTKAGPWAAGRKWKVCYVDGEMPLDSTQARDATMLHGDDGNITYLHHEHLFERTGKVLDLADAQTQRGFLDYCISEGIEILVLDNLSCLFRGVKENDADDWELVLPWLLSLRRHRIAALIVAHAGRNKEMRGTSRREDAAFWMLRLEEATDDSPAKGARFISRFTKSRNATESETTPLEWEFVSAGGETTITFKPLSNLDLFCEWVRDGLESASDIALEMGISKGTVSKLAKRAEEAGKITKQGRRYVLVS